MVIENNYPQSRNKILNMSPQNSNGDNGTFNEKPQILKLKELRESIKLCSEYTDKQIQNIDKKNLLYTTVTLIISLITVFGWGTVSGYLKIISINWIPASFLLWFLWLIYGIIAGVVFFWRTKKISKEQSHPPSEKGREMIINDWLNKTLQPPFIGIFLLYLLTFTFLIINPEISSDGKQNILLIPLISSIFFMVTPFILRINDKDLKRDSNTWLLIPALVLTIVFVLFLPYLAFMESIKLIPNGLSIEGIISFALILIFQIFLMLIFISSVSGLIAEFEMNKILNGLAKINEEINELLLNENKICEEKVEQLIQMYHMTKKYDVDIIRLFIFKTYVISPNRIFLEKC